MREMVGKLIELDAYRMWTVLGGVICATALFVYRRVYWIQSNLRKKQDNLIEHYLFYYTEHTLS